MNKEEWTEEIAKVQLVQKFVEVTVNGNRGNGH